MLVTAVHDLAISGITTVRSGYQALPTLMRARKVDIGLAEVLDHRSLDQGHFGAFRQRVAFTRLPLVAKGDDAGTALDVGPSGGMNALHQQDLATGPRRGQGRRIRAVGPPSYGDHRATSLLRGPQGRGGNTMSIRACPSHGDGILRERHHIGGMVRRRHGLVAPKSGPAPIDRVTNRPAPRGTPPDGIVQGHLARILAASGPSLPEPVATGLATRGALPVRTRSGGQDPFKQAA